MKTSEISAILNVARELTAKGKIFVPCFEGDAGIGKSYQAQKWARDNSLQLLDLRLAYMERPDLVGLPSVVTLNGKKIQINALPDFLPKEGEGLLLLEEPNRADEGVMNTLMQLLTDRKIHGYELPSGWTIAACINPEGRYNVSNMDAALKSRFAMFSVKYDHLDFVTYAKAANWHPGMVGFLESGTFVYRSPEEITDGFYVCPRNLAMAEAAMAYEDTPMFMDILKSTLGPSVAPDFYKFIKEIRPVLVADLIKAPKRSLDRLAGKKGDYRGDMLAVTVASVSDAFLAGKIDEALLMKVALVIEADQSMNLLTTSMGKFLTEAEGQAFIERNRIDIKAVKARLKGV